MAKNDSVLVEQLYPIVKEKMEKRSSQFKKIVGEFFIKNHDQIHDIAPYNRIYYNKDDEDKLLNAVDISREEIIDILKNCFFYNINYNPKCAKDPCTELLFSILRYYIITGQKKDAVMTTLYICFSGKFYASLHYEFWKYPPNKQIMDYVINNNLSDKFDLKKEGTIYKALMKMSETFVEKYTPQLKKQLSDEEITKNIQQLRDREKSFLKNISNAYYEAYNSGNYLNYEFQREDEDNFRITDNDAATAARITQNTMNKLTSQAVNTQYCNKASYLCKFVVKQNDIKDAMECILADNNNFPKLARLINLDICLFMEDPANKNERIGSAVFIAESLKSTPNTKNPYYIEKKQILVDFLNLYCTTNKRNIKRPDTRNNFMKSILCYICLVIASVV